MKRDLHFFTASFPFNNAMESSFILPELEQTAKVFNHIYIYAFKQNGEQTFSLPKNTTVLPFENIKVTLPFYLRFQILIYTLLESIKNKEHRKLTIFKSLYSQLKQYYINSKKITPVLTKNLKKDDLIYTFWFSEWNYALSILKKEKKVTNTFISRAHGFDLYNERHSTGLIPFRKLQLEHTDYVYSISKMGYEYLKQNFPKHQNKFSYYRLGTFQQKVNINKSTQNELTIASCSSISEVKQLHLIPDILKKVSIPLTWVHFGDGPLRDQIELLIKKLPSNIKVELKGRVENEKILNYYSNNRIDLFINVSKSEGIPVSMMEAISFGIPLLGFDVGGISEIVTNKTGILIDSQKDYKQTSTIINNFPSSLYIEESFRKKVKEFWLKNYSANTNHLQFAKKIHSL